MSKEAYVVDAQRKDEAIEFLVAENESLREAVDECHELLAVAEMTSFFRKQADSLCDKLEVLTHLDAKESK